MLAATKRQHIDRVILTATETPEQLDPFKRSWIRCVNDHGLDPTRPTPAHIVDNSCLKEHREQIEEFLCVARAGMEQLYKRVSSLGYVLLLTDSDGITVDYIGNEHWERELKHAGLYLGADWHEARAGTCGVGTCIAEKAPLTCHRDDHFDATHIGLTCTTAPLFDPTGGFMGVLDVSALTSPEARESQHLALHLTVLHAQMIETANFLRHFQNHWVLRLSTAWALIDVSGDVMLAFDDDGVVVGANSGARKHLGAVDGSVLRPLVGSRLTDLFKEDLDEIWRTVRGRSSDRAMLTTHSHELYYVSVVPRRVAPAASRNVLAEAGVSGATDCPALDRLAGDDRQMRRIIEQSKRLVNKKVNILVHGETGTGKEVLAKALHESSERRNRPFIAVNCAAIPESLIESELFGYTAGTFTGARNKGMKGLIQQSDGGTLFLDEIGDMPLHLQTRLLRVLSEREVMPLGADKPIPVDLTVVSASHRDLRRLIADGVFREDLYYRLGAATLYLPPLRERTDKAYVINRILTEEAAQMGMQAEISQSAFDLLLGYAWPGNVRQLRNVLRFALAICDDNFVEPRHLPEELHLHGTPHPYGVIGPAKAAPARPLVGAGDDSGAEAHALLLSLRKFKWNVTAAAQDLGICRATVYRQMKRFGIVPPNQS